MNKKQLDSLSSSLSKAINPAARKIEATAKILERLNLCRWCQSQSGRLQQRRWTKRERLKQMPRPDSSLRAEAVDVAVENTLAKMTTVAKTEA